MQRTGMFVRVSCFLLTLQIYRIPVLKSYITYRTSRVRYAGRTKTLTRSGVFLQGYTRTPGQGKHFTQIVLNCRERVISG